MLRKALRHLFGQGGVFALNAVVGLLIIRLIPPADYALVVIALFLQVATSVLSDLGLTHVLISRLSENSKTKFSPHLVTLAAISQRNYFSYFSVPLVFFLGIGLLFDDISSNPELICVPLVAVTTGFYQSTLNLRKAVLNSSHNNRALLKLGLIEGFIRVALLPLCVLYPAGVVVIAINLAATLLTLSSFSYVTDDLPAVIHDGFDG